MSTWILYISKLLSPNFFRLAKETNAVQLITIAFSHYCEIAGWALSYAGIEYREYGSAPLQHIFPALTVRVGNSNGRKFLSTSSRITDAVPPDLSAVEIKKHEQRNARIDAKARATAVPVAVCPNGDVLKDSWEIASYTGLPEIEPKVKKLIDEDIGPLARRLAYYYVLKPQNKNVWDELCTSGRHWIWKLLWFCGIGSIVAQKINKTMLSSDPIAVADCRQKLELKMEETNELVNNRPTKFLSGEKFGIADIALASAVAILVFPPQYYGGVYTTLFQKLRVQDKELHAEVEKWRNTAAGKYTMEIYENMRFKAIRAQN